MELAGKKYVRGYGFCAGGEKKNKFFFQFFPKGGLIWNFSIFHQLGYYVFFFFPRFLFIFFSPLGFFFFAKKKKGFFFFILIYFFQGPGNSNLTLVKNFSSRPSNFKKLGKFFFFCFFFFFRVPFLDFPFIKLWF